jgi:hypothetical protein
MQPHQLAHLEGRPMPNMLKIIISLSVFGGIGYAIGYELSENTDAHLGAASMGFFFGSIFALEW